MTIDPKRVQTVFLAALAATDAEARRALLDRECGNDRELRQRVEDLLSADAATRGFDAAPSGNSPIATMDGRKAIQAGSILAGRYKLIESVGEGGMGSVWVAEQKEPVKRKVAVKLIKPGMDSKQVLARFEAERQALAMMDHPNIAKVFDGGMTEQGRPFFVMEYVKGVPLTEYCDQARLSLRERLQLFIPVCQAVQHAHQKGIIHRDLKPSNILICLYDGKPVPKVIDFGLAKAMHQSLTDQSLYTAHGMMVGTPLYMSPEQAEHNNLDVDTRTDIYSLGVILYELLTGTTPLERQQMKEAAYNEILRLIKEVEPPKPSTRISGSASLPSIAAQRSIDPNHLKKSLTGDLDWIVMKALDKERSRRYETANGLSRDVERFLNDEAVEACPPSHRYRLRKFAKKYRKTLATAAAFAGLLIVTTSFSLFQAFRATTAEGKARDAQKRAEETEQFALEDFRATTDDAISNLLGSKEDFGPAERAYIEGIMQRWQKFAERQGDNVKSKSYKAEGHLRVSSLLFNLGRFESSLSESQTASKVYEELLTAQPQSIDFRRALLKTKADTAMILERLGRVDECIETCRSTVEFADALLREKPTDRQYIWLAARSNMDLAAALKTKKADMNAVRSLWRRVIALSDDVSLDGSSFSEEICFVRARCHNSMIASQFNQGDFKSLVADVANNVEEFRKLDQQSPQKYRAELAQSLMIQARVTGRMKSEAEALPIYQQALEILTALNREFPGKVPIRDLVVACKSQMGLTCRRLQQREQSFRLYEEALEMQLELVNEFPAIPGYKSTFADLKLNWAHQFRDEDPQRAREAYSEVCRLNRELMEKYPEVKAYSLDLIKAYAFRAYFEDLEGNIEAAVDDWIAISEIVQSEPYLYTPDNLNGAVRNSYTEAVGYLTGKLNHPDEAERLLIQYAKLRPQKENWEILAWAKLHARRQQLDESEREFESYVQVVSHDPKVPLSADRQNDLALGYAELAAIHLLIGHRESAERLNQFARQHFAQALEQVDVEKKHGYLYRWLDRLITTRNLEVAIDQLTTISELPGWVASSHVNLARRAGRAVREDRSIVERVMPLALKNLRAAFAMRAEDLEASLQLQMNRDFASLRDRPEFQQFVEQIGDSGKARLDQRLKEIAQGGSAKDYYEAILLGNRAYDTKQFLLAARLFRSATIGKISAIDRMQFQPGYNAVCCALLAIQGNNANGQPFSADEKAKGFRSAFDWLQEELNFWQEAITTKDPYQQYAAAQNLSHWKQDPDLELLRNSDGLSKLPAEERAKIESFWGDLDNLVETMTHKK